MFHHKTHLVFRYGDTAASEVKDLAQELNIELCYLPAYSPQLQPVEKVWNKVVKEVVIGKNVGKIEKQAFYKCSNLKTVTLKTKKLTASKVGAKAFTGTKVKTVKCPSGKKNAYRKFLVKKGIKKSAKFK